MDENLRDILARTLSAIDAAEIPESLRPEAFGKAFDYLSRGSLQSVGQPPADVATSAEPRRQESPPGDSNTVTDRIAQFLKVDSDAVEHVFGEFDGEPKLLVRIDRIAVSKTAGTQQLALLVTAARQGAGLEETTSTEVIREIAEDYKRLDPANYSKHIRAMKSEFIAPGRGPIKSVKLSRHGVKAAAELVAALGSKND